MTHIYTSPAPGHQHQYINLSSYKYIGCIRPRVFYDIPSHSSPRMTRAAMVFSANIFLFLIFISLGWTAKRVRSPSRQMMIEGYDVRRVSILMYLANKGLQYIPEGTFSDFPDITVSLCDLMSSMISSHSYQYTTPTNAEMFDTHYYDYTKFLNAREVISCISFCRGMSKTIDKLCYQVIYIYT